MPHCCRSARLDSDESGFSIVEVIIAIVMVTLIAAATATLTIGGIASAATQERRQIAVTVANNAIEQVIARSAVTNAATGVSDLYTGRQKSKVQSAFTAAASRDGVAYTYAAWDPTAGGSTVPAIPITSTVTNSGTVFTVTTLIGTCYLKEKPVTTAQKNCGKTTVATPTVIPSGYTSLMRVIVVVSWVPDEGCGPDGCIFEATTLIDPTADLEWIVGG